MSSLPEEIYHEILIRLPVKSTLVCKSVCKNWYALISNPDFVKLHHHLTIRKSKFRLMISRLDYLDLICTVSYDSSSFSSNEFHLYGVETNSPLGSYDFGMGSCNGLVCIRNQQTKLFSLSNPDNCEYYKELPESPNKPPDDDKFWYAFGYDYDSGDYKLVCLYQVPDGSVVDIYTTGSNSWKYTQIIPYDMCTHEESGGVIVNGGFHWLGYGNDSGDDVIVSLDVSKETFKEFKPPKEPLENKYWFVNLGVLRDCLCVLAYGAYGVDDIELWVMQDYGVEESWIRKYTITNEIIVKPHCHWNMKYMLSLNSGEILFARGLGVHDLDDLVLYDPKDGSVRKLNIHISGRDDGNRIKSLVLLGISAYAG